MALPNFIHAGASRCGTTGLYFKLRQHPDIYLPNTNEVSFFSRLKEYERGLGYYEQRHYSHTKGAKIVGDMTSTYIAGDAARRIHESLGKNVKFAFNLRNPVKRAISNYRLTLRQFSESESFEKSIMREGEYNHISLGKYFEGVSRYLKFYGKSSFFFFIVEDGFSDDEMARFFDFLEIAKISQPTIKQSQYNAEEKVEITVIEKGEKIPMEIIMNLGGEIHFNHKFPFKLVKRIKESSFRARFTIVAIKSGGRYLSVTSDPSPTFLDHIDRMKEHLTWKPSLEYESRLFHKYFKEDVNHLEQLLDRDLSCWYKNY